MSKPFANNREQPRTTPTIDGSAAIEQDGQVEETGPRQLWTELEQIAQEWTRLGRPAREEFELSVRYGTGEAVPTVIHSGSEWTAAAAGITTRASAR